MKGREVRGGKCPSPNVSRIEKAPSFRKIMTPLSYIFQEIYIRLKDFI